MKLLLITGVPGTGKTTIGNYLAEKYGYIHFDRELLQSWSIEFQQAWIESPQSFVSAIKKLNKDIVITWGFMPGTDDSYVLELKNLGSKLIWLDGNREAAKKAFLARGTVSEKLFNIQMLRIEGSSIQNVFNPKVFNTFGVKGNFLEKDEIVKGLLLL